MGYSDTIALLLISLLSRPKQVGVEFSRQTQRAVPTAQLKVFEHYGLMSIVNEFPALVSALREAAVEAEAAAAAAAAAAEAEAPAE